MKRILLSVLGVAAVTVSISAASAQQYVATLRGEVDLAEETMPPPIPAQTNDDLRKARNYPEQPPLIPHKIEGYQIDKNANRCLTCHARSAVEDSQAPMISVTHFMNRDNQVLASVSPRRYFCTQCHVPQHEAKPLVENAFVDVDNVLEYLKENEGGSD
ncbi:Periplasmic nitrate reductase, electron transfer subunit precursor [Pseudoruegeria aquimaris]|uniref:Periplasmic nitrate reductase, electron transfer subunit n=1 Tax=Pseudoruegeria aquimaris TaxID=393663 RepID=A0A1Y5SBN0_9RHOB|nr:nitrate reductase cytochrome c-type subunit [Pseudoruegeria aquimaris]SLN36672.1 Periplasmic nitrate reductase, electron transfer subunit precursor [Pseudoruegeria aquimaris]